MADQYFCNSQLEVVFTKFIDFFWNSFHYSFYGSLSQFLGSCLPDLFKFFYVFFSFYQGSISFDWPQLWAIISRHKIDVVLFVRIHGYLAEGQEAKSGQKNAEVSCFLRMVAFFKALVDIHFDVY